MRFKKPCLVDCWAALTAWSTAGLTDMMQVEQTDASRASPRAARWAALSVCMRAILTAGCWAA